MNMDRKYQELGMKFESPTEEFCQKVTWVSFIMSVLVVYIHANNLKYFGLENDIFSIHYHLVNIINCFGSIAVPYFFMLSGYWMFRFNIWDKDGPNILRGKLFKKCRTLLIPYLLWNTFSMCFYMVLTRMPFASSVMNSSDLLEFSVENLFRGVFLHGNNFPFWYLKDLIILNILSPILFLILKNNKLSFFTEILAIFLVVCSFDIVIMNSSSFFYFFTGAILALYGRGIFEKRIDRRRASILFLILLVTVAVRYINIPLISTLLLMISPIIVWNAIDIIQFPKNTWFVKQSFFIYAIHVILVTVFGKIMAKIFSEQPSYAYLITPCITIMMIYLVARLLKYYTPNFYKLICGNRV